MFLTDVYFDFSDEKFIPLILVEYVIVPADWTSLFPLVVAARTVFIFFT